jgi:beta-lactamase class A
MQMHRRQFVTTLAAVVGTAGPASAAARVAPAAPAGLSEEVGAIAKAAGGTWGVAAAELGSGRRFGFNETQRFKLASTLKLVVAAHALSLADQGRLSLAELVPVRREDILEPGILFEHFPHPGLSVSLLNLIDLSLTVSDNGASELVLNRVGGPAAVTAWARTAGAEGLRIDRTLAQTFAEPAPGAPPQDTSQFDTTTPAAMLAFLTALRAGRLLSPAGFTLLHEMMVRAVGSERLGGFMPPGVVVAHKTGTLFGDGITTNDVGYLEAPGRAPIAIAVYSAGVSEDVPAAQRDRTISNIARAIYDGFRG